MIGLNTHTMAILSGIALFSLFMVGCGGGHGNSSGRHGSGQGQPPSKEQLFTEFDKDNDGRLSQEEFPGPDAHFIRFDENGDGYLEKDEMPDKPPSGGRRG